MERDSSARRHLVSPAPDTARRMERSSRSNRGRVSRGRSRSRSRSPHSVRSRRSSGGRLRDQERELHQLRERLRVLEGAARDERGRLTRSRSRSQAVLHRRRSPGRNSETRNCSKVRQNTSNNNHDKVVERSTSPKFSTSEVAKLLNNLSSQPSIGGVMNSKSNDVKNIIPNFDPSMKNQRIDVWLKKVNECATVYGWDDKSTTHFALQKLQGLAKTWYESLNSILFSWQEWQEQLTNAFPHERNYGQSLEDMLRRKSRFNEPIEVYFYEKLALLNQCEIDGKRAVDCIIHGITDRTTKSSAHALQCTQPNQLLKFLMSNKDGGMASFDKSQNRNRVGESSQTNTFRTQNKNDNIYCYNCKEKGHTHANCTKPIIKCTKCMRFGHKYETCRFRINNNDLKDTNNPKTMRILSSKSSSKYYKDIKINGHNANAFIDFGSDVTVMRESLASILKLKPDNGPLPLRGFGNELVQSIGSVTVDVVIDDVHAQVDCRVVADEYLDSPLLIGQTFTEQPHIEVYKNSKQLQFFSVGNEMPFSNSLMDEDNRNDVKIMIKTDVMLWGRASIKVTTEPISDGYILVDSKLIGKPNQQLLVNGGVYRTSDGVSYIYVSPMSTSCKLGKGTIVGRATTVEVVRRIVTPESQDLPCDDIDISQIRIGPNVHAVDRNRLIDLLRENKHCFASSLQELGCTDKAEMNIELNSKKPVVYRPYRLAHTEREKVREMIDEMLEANIIRESASEYASPIILVRKKDGKSRLCVDYRMLNSITVKERYPMPIIEDEIARLNGQACFITLDLASGYYQVPISEQSKPLTAFVTPDGQYEFNRMPFGLANAPAVFQRMMNKVLGSARFSKATAYIDDLLIFGVSVDDCLEKLKFILQLLSNANLTLNLAKCEFLSDKIDYLGYEISALGIRPGDKKIQSVQDFPRPINQHCVRQFLGLVSYFRKFIQNFAQIAHPLNCLLKKDVDFHWSDEQEQAFVSLKERLVDRPVLAVYDPFAETELHTDASRIGIGGILLQRSNPKEAFRPVAYYSRQTSPEEKNFHSYELETLAVVCSLKKFRVYLLGRDFKIITDCAALRSTFVKRDLIPRIARWWLLIQEFQCTIEYRPGAKMSHVDALSRNPIENAEIQDLDQYPSVLSIISSEDWLQTLQLGDSELRRIKDILTTDMDTDKLKYIKDNYALKDNKLYKCIDGDQNNLKWVVPKGARWQLCRLNHDDIGHLGIEKTIDRIKRSYWFPKMAKFIKKYVTACLECAYAKKSSLSEGHLHPIVKIETPFHTIHIDHLGPFVKSKRGNSYLLVAVDAFTKFVFIKPVRNTKTKSAITILEDIFDTFKTPDRLISDRGSCFTSHIFKRFCSDRKIKHVLNAVASPQSNGQVERYNRTILSSLTALNMKFDEKDWDDKVGKVQWGLNNTFQKTTGRTPSEIMFGTSMSGDINPILNEVRQDTSDIQVTEIRREVKDRIDREQQKQKQYFDKKRRPARTYSEGDLVKITKTSFNNDGKSKKLLPSYIGPFRVVSVLGHDRYEVAAIPGLTGSKYKRKTTVSANRMMPWVHIAALEVNENVSDDDNDDSLFNNNDDEDDENMVIDDEVISESAVETEIVNYDENENGGKDDDL